MTRTYKKCRAKAGRLDTQRSAQLRNRKTLIAESLDDEFCNGTLEQHWNRRDNYFLQRERHEDTLTGQSENVKGKETFIPFLNVSGNKKCPRDICCDKKVNSPINLKQSF